MPYSVIEDLPVAVRAHLPAHAQEIFLAAFNNAWAQHEGKPDAEPVAFRIAWAAVKRRYRNNGGMWVPKGWG